VVQNYWYGKKNVELKSAIQKCSIYISEMHFL